MINYSIIIPHRNIPKLLQRCLGYIPYRDDVQIIVVDDNSDPQVVDFDNFPGMNIPNVEVYFTKEETTLSGEDMIVMLSDGAIMGDDKWLLSLIKSWNKGSCQELAEAVVEEAMRHNEGIKDDDITVLAVRLKDN